MMTKEPTLLPEGAMKLPRPRRLRRPRSTTASKLKIVNEYLDAQEKNDKYKTGNKI